MIYSPVRPVEVLMIVKRGRVQLYRIAADGRSVTTAVLGPWSVFGEMAPLGLWMRSTWAEALDGRRRPRARGRLAIGRSDAAGAGS